MKIVEPSKSIKVIYILSFYDFKKVMNLLILVFFANIYII